MGIPEDQQKKRHWGVFGKRDCRYCAFYNVLQTAPEEVIEDDEGNKDVLEPQFTSMCMVNAMLKGEQIFRNTGNMKAAEKPLHDELYYERLVTYEPCPKFKPNRWQSMERLLRGYW